MYISMYMYIYIDTTSQKPACYSTCYITCLALQHTATHCITLQHIATHCNTLLKSQLATQCAISRANRPNF